MPTQIQQLKQQLFDLKQTEPHLRSRQQADRLGISELELLCLRAGEDVIRLEGDWKKLLLEMHRMGYVMALSRNAHCVHERKGVYENIEFYAGPHNMGVAVNPDIDLRFFMNEWVYALGVIMHRPNGPTLYSFQFFNARGEAVHKIYSTPQSDITAYQEILAEYRTETQEPLILEDQPQPAPKVEKPDSEVDIATFQESWINLKDTHHFFGLLRKHGLSRTQALRLAPPGMVEQVAPLAIVQLLESAVAQAVPIMCFVHSPGCVQIHTGPIKKVLWHKDWYNVMDPAFNLHLDTTAIDSCYIVRKPTEDGIVTSLEIFDKEGELIVYFFGARKPGKPELESWRELLEPLPTFSAV